MHTKCPLKQLLYTYISLPNSSQIYSHIHYSMTKP